MQSRIGNSFNSYNNYGQFSYKHTRYQHQYVQRNQNFQQRRPYSQQNYQNMNLQYWCETCDKGFVTLHLLEGHKRRHERCNIDGCQFVAHPKIITKHIQMQHSTGLFKKIAKLNNPEEIKKWREERKVKYPTLANIKKKEAIKMEKINRGEKMGMRSERGRTFNKDFQDKKKHSFFRRRGDNHFQGKFNRSIESLNKKRALSNSAKQTQPLKKEHKIIHLMEESRKLKPFAGIQELIHDGESDEEESKELDTPCLIEDDEYINNNSHDTLKNGDVHSEKTVCSALTSLMSFYGSDEDEDLDDTTKEPKPNLNSNENISKSNTHTTIKRDQDLNTNTIKVSNANNNSMVCLNSTVDSKHNDADDDSGPEEVKTIKEKEDNSTVLPDNSKTTNVAKKNDLPCKHTKKELHVRSHMRKRKKLPSTLLEKLLHKEILHERNVILQCVRYVVKNNFFDKP